MGVAEIIGGPTKTYSVCVTVRTRKTDNCTSEIKMTGVN